MNLIVSGGRTGGHLVPGIALYLELKKRNINRKYIMSVFDLNFPITAQVDEADRILVDIKSISRKLSWRTPFYLLKIFKAFFSLFGQIQKYKPDAVIITGGYISNPVALSALLLRIPLYIVEQNSVAGITNRFYALFARTIFTSFVDTLKIPTKKAVLTGNPSIFKDRIDSKQAIQFFGLNADQTIIAVSGGSQGSKVLNNALILILEELKHQNIGLIWSGGTVDYLRLEKEGKIEWIQKNYPNVRIFQFIDKMDILFSAASIVISRAGATSISEFIHFNIPTLLIPIKNSPDNHQYLNAKFLEVNNAAIIISEDELNSGSLLKGIKEITTHLEDYKAQLSQLKKRYFDGKPEEKIIGTVLQEINSAG